MIQLKDSGEPSDKAESWDTGEKGTSDDEKSSRAHQARWEADNAAAKLAAANAPPTVDPKVIEAAAREANMANAGTEL